MSLAAITKTDLLARLAEGRAAGVTVITPNRRLAQVLRAEFDAWQSGRGLAVWEDADILPLESFVTRCHDDASYAEGASALPVLLSDAQSRLLWEEAIRASRWNGALLDVPRTAAHALEAWRLAHDWGIAGGLEKGLEKFGVTEDTLAFADWARAYARRLKKEGLTDAALLPGLGLRGRGTKLLVAYAFDVLKPQARDVLGGCEWVACAPERKPAKAVRTSFASPREELECAARWARARLEQGNPRIGVVVPDLQLRRREVARVFTRVMGSAQPFELSIGEPLADHPPVAFALGLLELSVREVKYETASRLIRSPFLGGATGEAAARARLDTEMRRKADAEISLPRLISLIEGCPELRQRLEQVYAIKHQRQSPHHWAQHFTALLEAAGFLRDRAPDSAEFQARAKFNETLGEFARLSLVSGTMSATEALGALRRLCAETLFQPEGPGAPVQVLGLLESAGIEFDALWVSGLTDGKWPQRVRPEPFLPAALQKKAGIPEASAEASLALDRRRTEGWLSAAGEVVLSWARREEDRELVPSPLIAQVPEGEVALPAIASWRDLIFQARMAEPYEDEIAPALAGDAARGGTRVLADQAACPFRAFASHRLRAKSLESPEPGLDAMARGSLLHVLMAEIWKEVKTRDGLDQPGLAAIIARAAKTAVASQDIDGPFAALEHKRLVGLAGEWLDLERERTPFEVLHTEERRTLEIGGLVLTGQIDRMDRLQDGTHAIIDYKTGSRASANDWMGERPAEPQLPLYAVTAMEPVSAVAFAKLRAGDMKFSGFSSKDGDLPGVKVAKSWSGLVEGWRAELESLAVGHAQGDARVEPKKGLATCRNCDLQTLCRVHEKLSPFSSDEEGAG
ncbi:MAG: PD-(D/E)XK nuclease family protein [Betaproteobacteria bacterium]